MKVLPTLALVSVASLALSIHGTGIAQATQPAGAAPAAAQASAAADPAAPASPAPASPAAVDPAAAAAVPAAAAPAAPLPVCELHVFPTLEGMAVTTGWGVGFGMIGAMVEASANKDRNVRDAAYLKEALGPRLQVEALKSVDMVEALKLPPSQVIFETPISDREVTTKAETRLTPSTAECYAELIVTQNFYHKAAIYGRSLNNRFVFKDFRRGKTKTNLIKGRGGNGLSHFPPASTQETELAEKELKEVFAKNFLEFTKGLGAKN